MDGLPAVYRTQTAAAALCDLEFSTWPNNFTASNFFVGAYQAVDAGTFALIDFAVYTRALNATDASLLWKQGPPGGGDALPPPPPPLAAPANSFALPKLAACAVAPPIHRFGDFNASVAPFAGGVLADANQTQPWTAVWRSLLQPATVPANQFITLGNLTTYYTSGAYVDAGPQARTNRPLVARAHLPSQFARKRGHLPPRARADVHGQRADGGHADLEHRDGGSDVHADGGVQRDAGGRGRRAQLVGALRRRWLRGVRRRLHVRAGLHERHGQRGRRRHQPDGRQQQLPGAYCCAIARARTRRQRVANTRVSPVRARRGPARRATRCCRWSTSGARPPLPPPSAATARTTESARRRAGTRS